MVRGRTEEMIPMYPRIRHGGPGVLLESSNGGDKLATEYPSWTSARACQQEPQMRL